jgi:hypothetical protein
VKFYAVLVVFWMLVGIARLVEGLNNDHAATMICFLLVLMKLEELKT